MCAYVCVRVCACVCARMCATVCGGGRRREDGAWRQIVSRGVRGWGHRVPSITNSNIAITHTGGWGGQGEVPGFKEARRGAGV